MKKINIISILIILIALTSCKKIIADANPSTSDEKPQPSEVGAPVGTAITKNFGVSGGVIVSADGKIELQIPAGAVNGNTDIAIQAITNNAPNGVSNAYRFMPDGLKFAKPVTLKIHYSAEEASHTLPGLMGIAFQDSTGIWWRINNFTDDAVNKIISAPIMHFSDWTLFNVMNITPSSAAVKVNQSVNLQVIYVNGKDGDDTADLAPLLRKVRKISWSVNSIANGNATVGTLKATEGDDKSRIYQAPAKVPSQNPVAVSAQIQIIFKYHGKTFNNTTLVSNISIYAGDERYVLEIRLKDSSWWRGMVAIDSVSMKIRIHDTTVTVSDIVNFASKAIPEKLVVYDATVIWIPDQVGELNIVNATGTIAVDFFGPSTGYLQLNFTESGSHTTKFHILSPPNQDQYYGGEPYEYLTGTFFHLITGTTYYESNTTGDQTLQLTRKLTLMP